ncbi:hypothetical protein ACSLBF_05955 [Pseudoalteromonas sp. T1lg65]|uniref:hypothetical protein n=1 Tax=Pseudoalteromonas sp. T1lg65 TaxID=2077101 RepID=UPI003F7B2A56
MSGTTMVFLIVLIVVGGGIVSEIYKKRLDLKKHLAKSSKEDEALKAELSALKKRIEVLEQLVTDEGYQLKKDIQNL